MLTPMGTLGFEYFEKSNCALLGGRDANMGAVGECDQELVGMEIKVDCEGHGRESFYAASVRSRYSHPGAFMSIKI